MFLENRKECIFIIAAMLGMISFYLICPMKNNRGNSMLPTLASSNFAVYLNSKLPGIDLERYDIVLANMKNEPQITKRIIGLPGEHVEVKGFDFFINGEKIDTSFIKYNTEKPVSLPFNDIVLGKDEYFLIGDNQEVSYDSRFFGPIKYSDIVGKIIWHIDLE